MTQSKILIVDDDPGIRYVIREVLEEEGFYLDEANDGEEGIKKVKQRAYDLAVVDLVMPNKDGFSFLEEVKHIRPDLITVVITAHGSPSIALKAIQQGAYDYFSKPFDNDELRIVIRRVLEKRRLEQKVRMLERQIVQQQSQFGEFVGTSSEMQEVFLLIHKVSSSDLIVIIFGESGTGKELVARAIHRESQRKDKPFIKVNCAAIPEELLESELFGYERGAFTGAYTTKKGKFEVAHSGTIFLDEIGDMSMALQSKLLRIIEQKEFEHLGSTTTIKIDVRIIAATNKDLAKGVREGTFREDLFFRLNVLPIHLPPLRIRKNDIPLLCDHFIEKYNESLNKNIRGISPEVMDVFMKYHWPGNVRELENAIQRAMVMTNNDYISAESLPREYISHPGWIPNVDPQIFDDFSQPLGEKLQRVSEQLEKMIIQRALREAQAHRQKAAELLGISRKSLHNKMVKYNLFEES